MSIGNGIKGTWVQRDFAHYSLSPGRLSSILVYLITSAFKTATTCSQLFEHYIFFDTETGEPLHVALYTQRQKNFSQIPVKVLISRKIVEKSLYDRV